MMDRTNEISRPFRGVIVGFGNVAAHAHVPAWLNSGHFSIEAVVEPAPERAEIARRLLPEARIYPTVEAAISDGGLDFVDICTPPCFHYHQVLSACEAGLHVFCEKPLTVSSEQLVAIQRMAERSQRVVFTVNNWKYAPLWIKAAELVGEGAVGAVRRISLTVLRCPNSGGGASNWRQCVEVAQGGILIDHGWHNLYIILSLMREAPLSVAAKMEPPLLADSDLEQTVDLSIQFPEAEAQLHLTWQASCRRNFGTVSGDRGKIHVDGDHLIAETDGTLPVRYDFPEALSAGSHHPEWMEPVVEDFLREILEPGRRGSNLAEARWCSRLIDLAYRSGRDGSCPIDAGCPAPEDFIR